MLNICRNNELNKNLAVWLCCGSEFSIVNFYLCQHCANHAVLESNAPHLVSYAQKNNLHERADTNRLQKAFLSLLPDQRLVIYLKVVKRYSNQDVADILSRSIGTVKAIQHHAMLILIHSVFSERELVTD